MQQSATPIPHSWQQFIWYSLGMILASAGTLLAIWFTRWIKRSQSKADVEKTKAETRSIDLNTTIHAGDIVLSLIREVSIATANVDRLRTEKEFWQSKAEALKAENELLEKQLDEQIRIGKPKP